MSDAGADLLAPLRGLIKQLEQERDTYREMAFQESCKRARLEGELEATLLRLERGAVSL